MGVDPKVWGPSAWDLIHSTAFNVAARGDTVSYNIAKHMYYSFLYILPCEKCRKNYDQHLLSLPIPASSAELPRWTFELHKRVSGTGNGGFSWAAAKQKWSERAVEWKNVIIFLDAISQTHPSARNIDAVYRDNLFNLLRGIAYFAHGDRAPTFNKTMLSSRYLFKMWLKKVKKKYGKAFSSVRGCEDYCLT